MTNTQNNQGNQENKVNTNSMKDKLKNQAQQGNVPQAQPEKQPQGKTMGDFIEDMMPAIKDALPTQIKAERMARLAMTVFKGNKKLQQCSPISFLGAVMQSVQLGLEPNTNMGEAYIIPYGKQATFQIGYQGIIKMAYNTGLYHSIYAHEVYKNDEFNYQLGLNKDIYHVPADVPEGDPVYYYAVYKLKNGGYDFVVWSRDRIIAHSLKYSSALKGDRDTPWKTNFISMARKTVLLQALKYAPKSIELVDAMEFDNTIKDDLKAEPKKVDEVIDVIVQDEESNGDQQGA